MVFPNNAIRAQFEEFISSMIINRFKNGSLIFWGKVARGDTTPQLVKPSKPGMCHDERFLNLWINDCPFSLYYLSDLPRYGHYQTVCDENKWL